MTDSGDLVARSLLERIDALLSDDLNAFPFATRARGLLGDSRKVITDLLARVETQNETTDDDSIMDQIMPGGQW